MGCGTGALLPDLQALSPADIYGADISLEHLNLAQIESPESKLTGANVSKLPFPDNTFEITLSHFFLMWIEDPFQALNEMIRVTRDNGYLICFAEPDYGGRLDYPPEFSTLKEYQIAGLINAGADPKIGRKLKSLFYSAGLMNIHVGAYEGRWNSGLSPDEVESEWQVLENDLENLISKSELADLKQSDQVSREQGTRLIYVPTFYAYGIVSK